MNEYFVLFQDIDKSIETLMHQELISEEMKQSAKNLKQSIEPCFQEIEQFTTKLNDLLQRCFNDLTYAEDVFNSKKIIAELPNHEIWKQIGDLSSCKLQINHLTKQSKLELIQVLNNSWNQKMQKLTCDFFYDSKNNFRSSLNLFEIFEKDNLIKALHLEIQSHIQVFKFNSQKIFQSLLYIHEEKVRCLFNYINYLDKKSQTKIVGDFNFIIESIINLIDKVFTQRIPTMSVNVKDLIDSISNIANKLGEQGVLGISWQQFQTSCKEVTTKFENIVTSIFDEFVRLANQVIEKALIFYSNLLEQQRRYKQETPEQCETEKAWIQNQRQKLQQVQNGIDQIRTYILDFLEKSGMSQSAFYVKFGYSTNYFGND